jgi:type IV pilus assembly protein PilM
MDSVSIGLDIGSSAVRAAEVHATKDRRRYLRRYGQVGLPPGYVVDGEIVNIPGVSAALRRLWTECGFTSSKVVLGVSGPRVFVRQADVPALNPDEIRSSLKFDAQELIPIPMEDASFDFSVLEPGQANASGGTANTRILIVAAHRELLRNYLATLKGAGLSASTMDASPLALVRAVPCVSPESSGTEVLVSIGAELTTVAVRERGIPRFIRSLTVGGSKLTETIASSMHLELAVAERLKRGQIPSDAPQLSQARKAMSVEMRDLAEDVRGTVDFFISQSGGATIERLLITGGASQTDGLAAAIAGNISAPINKIDPFNSVDIRALNLPPDQIEAAGASSTTAIGLALWPFETPLIRLSVLPDEVMAAKRMRRLFAVAACGVAGVAALLGVAGAGELYRVHSAKDHLHSAQARVTQLNQQVNFLTAETAVHAQAQARASLVKSALGGDVDWVRVLGQLAAVMPSNVSLTNFQGSRTTQTASVGTSGSNTGTQQVGTINLSVKGTGGLPAAKSWLVGLQKDPDLDGTWVNGIIVQANGGALQFSSTTNLTAIANSHRDQAVQP